jgi:DNA-binding IclR family transcriptional regulator
VLDVLLKAGIADIVTTEEEGTSVAEIAEKTGMNADKLVRVMHLLTSMDLFTEVSERHFRLTSLGKQYQKGSLLHPIFVSQYHPHLSLLTKVSNNSILASVCTMR